MTLFSERTTMHYGLERTWTGGEYEAREGIVLSVGRDGISVQAWYDGGILVEPEAAITWDELAALRQQASA